VFKIIADKHKNEINYSNVPDDFFVISRLIQEMKCYKNEEYKEGINGRIHFKSSQKIALKK